MALPLESAGRPSDLVATPAQQSHAPPPPSPGPSRRLHASLGGFRRIGIEQSEALPDADSLALVAQSETAELW
jgi:hypothetical protein